MCIKCNWSLISLEFIDQCTYVSENTTKIFLLAISCPFLSFENGEIQYSTSSLNEGYPLNTVVTFSCDQHYNREGPSSVICQISGNWSQETPTCNASNENNTFME